VAEFALFEWLPATRDTARRLGLVTLEQVVAALTHAVEDPPERLRICAAWPQMVSMS
jgi:hypothetical protein